MAEGEANWWVVLFTGMLALVAVMQFAAAGLQAWWTREAVGSAKASADAAARAVDIAEKTSLNQLRAYVCYVRSELVDLGDVQPVAHVIVKNCGQTPASNLEYWGLMSLAATPLNAELSAEGRPRHNGGVLSPNGEMFFQIDAGGEVKPDHLALVKVGKAGLYVHGGLAYTDIFGNRRETLYRLVYDKRCAENPKGNSLSTCREGNVAT